MVDFADGLSNGAARRRLATALEGRGAFSSVQETDLGGFPDLIPHWHGFRDMRAKGRAVDWLLEQELIGEDAAGK